MTRITETKYKRVQEIQQTFCEEKGYAYFPAEANAKVGLAMETQGRLPINGLRHPAKDDTTGWYLWSGEEFPQGDDSFSPVHAHHLIQLRPEVLKFLGLPPGFRFLVAGDYTDVWYDPTLLTV